MTALDAAVAAASRGWRPFPLDHKDAGPECIGLHRPGEVCRGRGKHPVVKFGTATQIVAPQRLLRTWFGGAPRNIGIACKPSGLVVIDQDTPETLDDLAASLGERCPVTYRVRTRRGWHPYFLADPQRPLGNSAGALAAHGMDVRGGGGTYGGYVVGAGSVHESGHVYTAEDDQAQPARLPDWLYAQISGPDGTTPRGSGRLQPVRSPFGPGWDDAPRKGTAQQLTAQYERHLAGVVSPTGEFRHELYLAALDGWRLVDVGLLDERRLVGDLRATLSRVWDRPPDSADDEKFDLIVNIEAKGKAALSPWAVVEGGHDDDSTADPYAIALAAEERRQRIHRAVKDKLAAEDTEPLVKLSAAQFMAAPTPDYLIPRMLYRDGLAVVFGAPGAAKSFLMLDLVLSLATGTAWRDDELPRSAVHYVMAEGQAVNVWRTQAWLEHHEIDAAELDGYLHVFPAAVLLTDAGIAPYLEHVHKDRPALIVLDTKNLMFNGKESAGEDYGAMLRVLHCLRRAAGGACVVLVDHTGLHDTTRARGSNAQQGGIDTEVMVSDTGTGVRLVEMTRDKASGAGADWAFRLKGVGPAAVCIPLTDAERTVPWAAGEGWWRHDHDLVPDEVASLGGKGRSAARDIFRVLRYVDPLDGLTAAQLWAMVGEGPREHARSAFFAGLAQLQSAAIVVTGRTPALHVLSQEYATERDQEIN